MKAVKLEAKIETEELAEARDMGGFEQKYSTKGLARCALCGAAVESIEKHLAESHGIDLSEYQSRFPDWPLVAKKTTLGKGLSFADRETAPFEVKEAFGFHWPGKKKKSVSGFKSPGPLTPEIDPGYVFNPEATQVALLALHLKIKCLTYGPTGSGKTTMWEQIAARLNYNFVRVNFDAGITRADLVGQYVVKGREMEFSYGILPTAMTLPGTIIVLDEWDSQSEECSFVMQRPLEKKSQLLIMEKGEELISLHPSNIIVATANTAGMGDDTGLYAGTRVQNFAQLNRFEMTIVLDYLPAKEEKKILLKKFSGDITEFEAEALIQVTNKIRQAYEKGDLSAPLSTRDLINWSEKYCIWGLPEKSAKYCFVNRYPYEDRDVIMGLIKRAFDM